MDNYEYCAAIQLTLETLQTLLCSVWAVSPTPNPHNTGASSGTVVQVCLANKAGGSESSSRALVEEGLSERHLQWGSPKAAQDRCLSFPRLGDKSGFIDEAAMKHIISGRRDRALSLPRTDTAWQLRGRLLLRLSTGQQNGGAGSDTRTATLLRLRNVASIIIPSLSMVSIAAFPEAQAWCGESEWFSKGFNSFPGSLSHRVPNLDWFPVIQRFLSYGRHTTHGTQATSAWCSNTSQTSPQGMRGWIITHRPVLEERNKGFECEKFSPFQLFWGIIEPIRVIIKHWTTDYIDTIPGCSIFRQENPGPSVGFGKVPFTATSDPGQKKVPAFSPWYMAVSQICRRTFTTSVPIIEPAEGLPGPRPLTNSTPFSEIRTQSFHRALQSILPGITICSPATPCRLIPCCCNATGSQDRGRNHWQKCNGGTMAEHQEREMSQKTVTKEGEITGDLDYKLDRSSSFCPDEGSDMSATVSALNQSEGYSIGDDRQMQYAECTSIPGLPKNVGVIPDARDNGHGVSVLAETNEIKGSCDCPHPGVTGRCEYSPSEYVGSQNLIKIFYKNTPSMTCLHLVPDSKHLKPHDERRDNHLHHKRILKDSTLRAVKRVT
ncbi:hypothetical protein EK904_009911 [Melospiza melodia maxima]|nr:hypothetical protein EK904_009911 [Melospiza melodia maxima]